MTSDNTIHYYVELKYYIIFHNTILYTQWNLIENKTQSEHPLDQQKIWVSINYYTQLNLIKCYYKYYYLHL